MTTKNFLADGSRFLLGLTFVFSGFVKTIDPWGTVLKIGEYLGVWGLGSGGSDALKLALAILACAAELTLGLMLVFGVKTRLTSLAAIVVMAFFLVVTFLSATVLPVGDCGCFGDAVKLSPWGSFAKNVVLMALAVFVWWDACLRRDMPDKGSGRCADMGRAPRIFPILPREWGLTALFGGLSAGLALFCWAHLPLVDFLPFREGVDLRGALYGEQAGNEDDIVLREFAIFGTEGDITETVLNDPGRVSILFAADLDDISPACEKRFAEAVLNAAAVEAIDALAAADYAISIEDAVAGADSPRVILVTSSPVEDGRTVTFGAAPPVPVYNMGSSTMIAMLRARTGMVVISDGVIVDKKNCRDIR